VLIVARRHPLRRIVTPGSLLVLVVALFVGAVALWSIPSHDYIFLPDRAHPVAPLVSVAGGHDPANGGAIYFVDVIVRKATLLEQLLGGLESGSSLYPSSEVVPAGVTGAQEENVDLSEMASSQQIAAAVALRTAGRKVTALDTGALVEAVEPGKPAADRLEPTDVIVAIDGKRVRSPADVAASMATRPVGSTVSFTVLRDHKDVTVALRTVPAPPHSKRGIVGVYLGQNQTIRLPIHVSIDAHGIGGPSAGLAFALEVLQQLGRNVDHGHKIAATGEIFLDGQVGAIGGIEQKTIGAREAHVDAFLVPAGQNATDARKYAHGLRIIPVKSFQQALYALATLTGHG
jgi:PDZ domain-containing protein